MAAVTPPIRWGSREVNLGWVPESAGEMVATARPLLAEMTGALAFTFIAGAAIIVNSISNGGLGLLGIAVATALAYGIIVSAFYSVSGGHLNPAVTLAHLAARRIPVFVAILYVGVQLVGAVLGALLLEFIFRDYVDDASRAAMLSFDDRMGAFPGAILEAILTFLLVVVYFRAFVDPKGDRATGGIAVGVVVLFGMLVAFPLTGGAMNLARVFGTDFVAGEWADFGSYAIGLIGGFAAGLVYQYFFISREET
jgi:glycerol uptake facilitator-like aquaporin